MHILVEMRVCEHDSKDGVVVVAAVMKISGHFILAEIL